MKRLALLGLLLMGCQGCAPLATVPRISVPDTQNIHEFLVDTAHAKVIFSTFVSAVEGNVEKGLCAYGYVEVVEADDFMVVAHRSNESFHLRLVISDLRPARFVEATNTSILYTATPCDEGSIGMMHTHIVEGTVGPSWVDVETLWMMRDHLFTAVIGGIDISRGKFGVLTVWRIKHGAQFHWVLDAGSAR